MRNRHRSPNTRNRLFQLRSGPAADPIAQLKELGELHQSGVLTDEESAAQKAKMIRQLRWQALTDDE